MAHPRCDSMAFLIILTAIVWASFIYGYVSTPSQSSSQLLSSSSSSSPTTTSHVGYQHLSLVYIFAPGSQTLIGPFLDEDCHASNNFAIKQVFCFLWCKMPIPLSICFIEILIWYTISFCIYIWKVDGLLVLQHKHLCSGGGSLCHLSCYWHKGESQDSQNEPFFVFLVNVLYLLRAWTSNLHKMSSISLKYCSLCFCCCLQVKRFETLKLTIQIQGLVQKPCATDSI